MNNKVVHHGGRRFKRVPDKRERDANSLSVLPPPAPPTEKSRDSINTSFSYKRFKPLPSIGSQNALVETDSAIDIQSPDFSSSHMTSNIGSHDHYHHTPKQQHTVPPEPCPTDSHTVTLCVRLPDGSRSQRRFNHSTHTLQQLLVWAVLTLPSELGVCSPAQVELVSSTVPKVVYRDWSLTLGEAGLTQNTLLCLTIL